MREEIKRISDLCERNAIEISLLKHANKQKEFNQTVETVCYNLESVDGGVFKSVYFNSEDGSGVCFNTQLKSGYLENITLIISVNDKEYINQTTTFPIEKEIAFLPKKGENKISISVFSAGSNFTADINVKVSGYIVNQPIGGCLRYINGDICAFHDGDTLKLVSTSSLNTVYSLFNVKNFAVTEYDGNVLVMTYDKTGVSRFIKITLPFFSSSNIGFLSSGFTSCAIRPYNDRFIVYGIRDNSVHAYLSNGSSSTYYGKLPIKAKDINYCEGELGDYIYYTDLRDNITVIKLDKTSVYQPIGRYSLGKKQNLILSQISSTLKILYKTGEVVAERSIGDLSDISVIGKGFQAVKLPSGNYVVLRDGKLQEIKGENK